MFEIVLAMATLKQKIAAERKVRELVEDAGVPMPDEVEYGYGCVRLFWHGPQVLLEIDIDGDARAAGDEAADEPVAET